MIQMLPNILFFSVVIFLSYIGGLTLIKEFVQYWRRQREARSIRAWHRTQMVLRKRAK